MKTSKEKCRTQLARADSRSRALCLGKSYPYVLPESGTRLEETSYEGERQHFVWPYGGRMSSTAGKGVPYLCASHRKVTVQISLAQSC